MNEEIHSEIPIWTQFTLWAAKLWKSCQDFMQRPPRERFNPRHVHHVRTVLILIAVVWFFFGASKMPGFVGTGFDPREVDGTTLMLTAIFFAVLVKR